MRYALVQVVEKHASDMLQDRPSSDTRSISTTLRLQTSYNTLCRQSPSYSQSWIKDMACWSTVMLA